MYKLHVYMYITTVVCVCVIVRNIVKIFKRSAVITVAGGGEVDVKSELASL